jgi:Ca2+-binding EF-hand superfamily protein
MKSLALSCSLAILFTNVAYSQDDADLFGQLDKNNDGKLVASEIPADKKRFFDRVVRIGDKNEDGQLTKSEFQAATSESTDTPVADTPTPNRPQRGRPGASRNPEEVFARFDRDKDGKLTRKEAPEPFGRLFDQLKKDSVTLEEFKKVAQRREGNAGRPAQRPEGKAKQQSRNPNDLFKQLDTNKDGKLTVAEVPDKMKPILTRALEKAGRDNKASLSKDEFVRMASKYAKSSDRPSSATGDRPSTTTQRANAANASRTGQSQGPAFFRLLDKNRDGALDASELARASTVMSALDGNKDGKLDMRELFGAQRSRSNDSNRPSDRRRTDSSERPRPNSSDRPKTESRPKSQPKDRPATTDRVNGNVSRSELFKRMFQKLDQDSDGAISKAEATGRLKENFEKVDANSDGKVQLKELEKVISAGSRKE